MRPKTIVNRRAALIGLAASFVVLTAFSFSAGSALFRSDGFLPHGVCYTWNPLLVGTHLVSDVLIGASYLSIPIALFYVWKKRPDWPYTWIFLLFGLFIVSCGLTHWMEVLNLWTPWYWLSGAVKATTALASVPTAVVLWHLLPKALAIPSVEDLKSAKAALETEVVQRQRVEQELRAAHATLEVRVEERTADLQQANEELDAQRAALREADRKKDEFIAVLAHELRNPLQAVRAAVDILQRLAPTEPQLVRAHDMISRQVSHLSRLLDDLLDVSRISTGRFELRKKVVRLEEAVEHAVETSRYLMQKKQQHFEKVGAEQAIHVEADPTRLAQVISNVLTNASNYTPERGTIRLTVERRGADAIVSVRDTGIGIAQEHLRAVFGLFSRIPAGAGRHAGPPGMGVGLALAQHLVHMHGGSIHVCSDGVGRGSEFVVTLPAVAAPLPGAAQGEDAAHGPCVKAMKIVVADDNVDAADSLSCLLTLEGHEVVTGYDGDDAVRLTEDRQPDIVLLDIGMPRTDGYQAARRIREASRGKERPYLIAVTGWGQEADKQRIVEAGFDQHLTKPVEIARLRAALSEAQRRQ